jgi:hypothetical protein
MRKVSAARSAPRIVDHPDRGEENATARLLLGYHERWAGVAS